MAELILNKAVKEAANEFVQGCRVGKWWSWSVLRTGEEAHSKGSMGLNPDPPGARPQGA